MKGFELTWHALLQICLRQHEHDMEVAFAYAKSKEKTCGICMEVVVDKQPKGEARFGIMPNCNHCFCLGCLRTWRQAKNFESKVIRSCPECRITSDFICPSRFWVSSIRGNECYAIDEETWAWLVLNVFISREVTPVF